MKKFNFLFIIFLLGPLYAFSQSSSKSESIKRSSPNLIIILADDLGYSDVGFNGGKDIPTPNIDRIAKEGVKFTNSYVSYAVCGPSRAGLITGRYQDRFGFGRNPLFTPNDTIMGLPSSEETLAEALQKAGYKSAALGKWHLGAHPSQWPLRRGFDNFFGFLTGGHRYFPEEWTLEDEYEVTSQFEAYRTKLLRDNERIEENEYLTDALSREAVNYIDEYKDNPFFIYLAYNAPHAPLQATDKYLKRFRHIKDKKRRTYAAMVSSMDDGVGRVLDKLEELNLSDNTIVVFLSDNGGPESKNASENDPLRGGKGDLFDGGVRVPFAMRWPAKIPRGTIFEKSIISLDIFSTIVAQTAEPIKTRNSLDGKNLIPYLTGETKGSPHDYLYWRKFDQHEYAMRNSKGDKMVIKQENKMLFDLSQDISEKNNIIKSNEDRFEQLKREYEKWRIQMKDPIFMGLMQNEKYNKEHPDRFLRNN